MNDLRIPLVGDAIHETAGAEDKMLVTHRLQIVGRDCLGRASLRWHAVPNSSRASHLYGRLSDLQALLVPRIKSIQLVCGGKVQMLLANGGQRGRIDCVEENVIFGDELGGRRGVSSWRNGFACRQRLPSDSTYV